MELGEVVHAAARRGEQLEDLAAEPAETASGISSSIGRIHGAEVDAGAALAGARCRRSPSVR